MTVKQTKITKTEQYIYESDLYEDFDVSVSKVIENGKGEINIYQGNKIGVWFDSSDYVSEVKELIKMLQMAIGENNE